MISYDQASGFLEYLELYPDEDEPGFDGVHYGGIRGIREDAPESAKEAFKEYQEAIQNGIKI